MQTRIARWFQRYLWNFLLQRALRHHDAVWPRCPGLRRVLVQRGLSVLRGSFCVVVQALFRNKPEHIWLRDWENMDYFVTEVTSALDQENLEFQPSLSRQQSNMCHKENIIKKSELHVISDSLKDSPEVLINIQAACQNKSSVKYISGRKTKCSKWKASLHGSQHTNLCWGW